LEDRGRKGERKMKVIINKCYGGFGIDSDAREELHKLGSKIVIKQHGKIYENRNDKARSCPIFVKYVEEHTDVNGEYAALKVVEIPDGTNYVIEEYDGMEWIAEKHKIWS